MRVPRPEHYGILKITPSASLEDIKKAYRKRAFELHPDLHPDNPNANKEFQLLNESYVLLSAYVEKKNAPKAPKKPQSSYQSSTEDSTYYRQKDPNTFTSRTQTKKEEPKAKPFSKSENLFTNNYKRAKNTDEPKTESHRRTYSKAQSAYSKESDKADSHVHSSDPRDYANYEYEPKPTPEDLMQDILNDPFARRVYEDIYRTLEEQQQNEDLHSPYTAEKKKKKIINTDWISEKIQAGSKSTGTAKSWLKKQIDDHIEYRLPLQSLHPRARIRLQIGQGFSSEPRTVEITLPSDFVIGKPVRLSGLGKKFGKWTGDLYITFLPNKED